MLAVYPFFRSLNLSQQGAVGLPLTIVKYGGKQNGTRN